MNKLVGLIITFFVMALPLSVQAANVQDFDVPSFKADYYLSKDGETSVLAVDETITTIFPNFDQNHGILRAIPEKYDNHNLEIKINSVKNAQDEDLKYETSNENGNLVLKIGDPDEYVHGDQVYKISYVVRGATLNFADHDELYWDVNGDQWFQSIDKVEARVHLSPDLAVNLQQQKLCFTGGLNDTTQYCEIDQQNLKDGAVIVTVKNNQASTPLMAGQTLTFVLGFAPEAFGDYVPSQSLVNKWIFTTVTVALPPLVALIIVIRNWRKYGRDPKGRGVIVPEYLPPKKITVLESNALLTEKFESKALTAQVIDLAVRHFIKIYELKTKQFIGNKTDYELEFIGNHQNLNNEEREVLGIVFGSKNPENNKRIKLSEVSKGVGEKARKLGKDINENLAKKRLFRISPEKAMRPYIIVGFILIVVGFIFMPWTLGLVLAAAVLFIASGTMPARTAEGVEQRDYLLGLKMYMELAEAERIKIMQSPHGSLTQKIDINDQKQLIKLYEKLLPYAMLFGIEKDWAKQFAHLYTQEPDWYHSSSAFNSAVFVNSFASFNSISATSFAPPSSSDSSGFSGGSAGGGGGGGGGGGW